MDDLVHRMALRLKLHKTSGSVVHHVALLKRAMDQLGVKTQFVKGYCVIPQTSEACEHYWVRTEEGLDLDVGFEVARLKNPELMALRPVLLETLPPGLTRSDQGETMILEENQRLYDLHQADPKEFWREAPRDVATFHVK
jgi:hypothetical protein